MKEMEPGSKEATSTETPPENAEAEQSSEKDESLGTRSELEILGPCKRRVKASVPADKVRRQLDLNYDELTSTVQIPGFRRGRVPRKLLEKRFGEDVEAGVQESLLSQSFSEVIEERELRIIGSPRFDNLQFSGDQDFNYEAEFEVQPEFGLPEYIGVEVEEAPSSVGDAEVDAKLEEMRRQHAELVPRDPAQAGPEDILEGRYFLHLGDVRVKTQDQVSFRPQGGWIGEFEVEDLPGKVAAWDRSGDAPLRLAVKVPPFYPDEVLRDKDATLEFFLSDARGFELPALDEAFARKLGEESVDELKAAVRKSLEATQRRQAENETEQKIVRKLVAATDISLPEELIEKQLERLGARREQELIGAERFSKEEIAESLAKLSDAEAGELRQELKEFFLLQRIGDQEKIFATEAEVNHRLQAMAMIYRVAYPVLREELEQSGRIEEVRLSIRSEKVKAFLRKKAKLVKPGEQAAASAPESAPASADEPVSKAEPAPAGGAEEKR
jgi:trigger factor